MGRNRRKAGSVGSVTYDIFGNVVPESPAASTSGIPDVADEDMIEDQWYPQEEEDGTPYLKLRVPNGQVITAEAGIAATEDQDGYDARSTDTFNVMDENGTVLGEFTASDAFDSENRTWNPDALVRAANEWIKNNTLPTKNTARRERANRAISNVLRDVLSLTTDNPRNPKENVSSIKALDVQELSDNEISDVEDQVDIALRDNLAPAIMRILLQSPDANQFSVDILPSLRAEMRQLLRGVDTLGIVSASLRREIERRSGQAAGAAITRAEAERLIIPAIRNQLRGEVQYLIRQQQRNGNPVPDWAKNPGKFADYVERSLDFDPIDARRR